MKTLLFLIITFIVQHTTAQTDTSIYKKKAIKDTFRQSAAILYPPAQHVITFSQSTIKSIEKSSSKTYLYWDSHLQMFIKKPYTSYYKEPRLLNPAQTVLSFIIPNNAGKP